MATHKTVKWIPAGDGAKRILDDILRAESRAPSGSRHKATINIYLGGGPPHQDMWDIKTKAPSELRGKFRPISTKVQGPVDPSAPDFVGLAEWTQHSPWSDPGQSGFLGPAFGASKPDGLGLANMKLSGITLERLADGHRLLAVFDNLRRDIDASGLMDNVDAFTEQAFNVLTTGRFVKALDLSEEDSRVRECYGDGKPYKNQWSTNGQRAIALGTPTR